MRFYTTLWNIIVRPRENILTGPIWGENIWNLLSKTARSGVFYIFEVTAGPSKCHGARGNELRTLFPLIVTDILAVQTSKLPLRFSGSDHR